MNRFVDRHAVINVLEQRANLFTQQAKCLRKQNTGVPECIEIANEKAEIAKELRFIASCIRERDDMDLGKFAVEQFNNAVQSIRAGE